MIDPQGHQGSGGAADIDPHHARRDLAFLERAVTNGWDIPEDYFATLPAVLANLAVTPNQDDRVVIRAINVLRAMAADRVRAAYVLDRMQNGDPLAGARVLIMQMIQIVGAKDPELAATLAHEVGPALPADAFQAAPTCEIVFGDDTGNLRE